MIARQGRTSQGEFLRQFISYLDVSYTPQLRFKRIFVIIAKMYFKEKSEHCMMEFILLPLVTERFCWILWK